MKSQIIELEKKYWQGMENHDYETIKSLTRFPCIVAGKDGVQSIDEDTFKKMFESTNGNQIKVLNISDVETQLIGENAAVIAYQIELANDNQKESLKCACTSTWTKENNNLVCVLHTEVELSQQ
jgi:hypothetical protein